MLMILEAMQMQCYDAMRDLRVKIGVLQAVNSYGNGIGAVIITPQGTHFPFTPRLTFKCTNNMAEYEAWIMGLEGPLIL